MENKMKEVAKILGVKLGEPFNVEGRNISNPYTLTDKGLTNCGKSEVGYILTWLLCGELTIEKIPFKPKCEVNMMENIKCPICGGKVELSNTFVNHSQKEYMKHFKLVCCKCGLTSREVAILVYINHEGEIVSMKDTFNELLKEWGNEYEK